MTQHKSRNLSRHDKGLVVHLSQLCNIYIYIFYFNFVENEIQKNIVLGHNHDTIPPAFPNYPDIRTNRSDIYHRKGLVLIKVISVFCLPHKYAVFGRNAFLGTLNND